MKHLFSHIAISNRVLFVFNLVVLSFLLFIYAKEPYRIMQANRLEIVNQAGRVVYRIDENGVLDKTNSGNPFTDVLIDNNDFYKKDHKHFTPPFTFKKGILYFQIYDARGEEVESVYFTSFVNKVTIDRRLEFDYIEKTGEVLYNNGVSIGHAENLEQAESVSIDYYVTYLYAPKRHKAND